jgi:hypothetical protein
VAHHEVALSRCSSSDTVPAAKDGFLATVGALLGVGYLRFLASADKSRNGAELRPRDSTQLTGCRPPVE